MAAVETELESRNALIGLRGECKSAKGDQEALRCHGIGNDDADQRPPEPLGPSAKFDHLPPLNPNVIIKTVRSKVNVRMLESMRIAKHVSWLSRPVTIGAGRARDVTSAA